jgi:hypothetical protein
MKRLDSNAIHNRPASHPLNAAVIALLAAILVLSS